MAVITFHLDEPICNCKSQNLSWRFMVADERTDYGLVVFCQVCGVVLQIPESDLRALFSLKKSYPGGAIVACNRANMEFTAEDFAFLRKSGISMKTKE